MAATGYANRYARMRGADGEEFQCPRGSVSYWETKGFVDITDEYVSRIEQPEPEPEQSGAEEPPTSTSTSSTSTRRSTKKATTKKAAAPADVEADPEE